MKLRIIGIGKVGQPLSPGEELHVCIMSIRTVSVTFIDTYYLLGE